MLDNYNKSAQVELHIKLWQAIIATISILIVFISGWININMQVKQLEVQQNNQLIQIQNNTKKIEIYYKESVDNQFKTMKSIYEIKVMLEQNKKEE